MSTATLERGRRMGIDDELLTVKAAAARKGVRVSTVYKAISDGRLPHVEVLDRVALRITDVDAWQPEGWGGKRTGQGRPKKQAEE